MEAEANNNPKMQTVAMPITWLRSFLSMKTSGKRCVGGTGNQSNVEILTNNGEVTAAKR
jgi:hypothetical protein